MKLRCSNHVLTHTKKNLCHEHRLPVPHASQAASHLTSSRAATTRESDTREGVAMAILKAGKEAQSSALGRRISSEER